MAQVTLTTILFAIAGGAVPTLLWLWFWITKDDRPEPGMVLTLAYIGGILSVLVLFPLRSYVESLPLDPIQVIVLYAALEEVSKFVIIALACFGNIALTKPTDYTVYLVTGALGFSAIENTFYLLGPLLQSKPLESILVTGNLRFFGATVLHTVAVAIVGVLIGLAFSSNKFIKAIHAIIGIALGIGLHSAFNYFIMQGTRQGTMVAVAGVWFVAVIIILLFDRLHAFHDQIRVPEFKLPS